LLIIEEGCANDFVNYKGSLHFSIVDVKNIELTFLLFGTVGIGVEYEQLILKGLNSAEFGGLI